MDVDGDLGAGFGQQHLCGPIYHPYPQIRHHIYSIDHAESVSEVLSNLRWQD